MIAQIEKKSRAPLWIGFFGVIVSYSIASSASEADPASLLTAVVVWAGSIGLFIWGCCLYCRAKGHSPYLGLLALLFIFGLFVLACLPDKHPKGQTTEAMPRTLPPPPYAPPTPAASGDSAQLPPAPPPDL